MWEREDLSETGQTAISGTFLIKSGPIRSVLKLENMHREGTEDWEEKLSGKISLSIYHIKCMYSPSVAKISTEHSLYTANKKPTGNTAWSFLLAFKMEMEDICTIVLGSNKAV